MNSLSPNERLLRALAGKSVDRSPVICPGGMMNSAVVEIMEASGTRLPAAHSDDSLMAALARSAQELTGFENFGLPFCMTIEAEALGSEVDLGSLKCEPKIAKEALASAADYQGPKPGAVARSKRGQTVLRSLQALNKAAPDIPAIGSLTGPISLAASLVEPAIFLRQLRKNPPAAHKILDSVSRELIDFAAAMVESGAQAICVNDPTATGEILGPKLFREYASIYINQIADAARRLGVPVIVHICGDVRMVAKDLAAIRSDALSFDAMVSLREFKKAQPGRVLMGNLSTYLLEFGDPEKVARAAEALVRQGVEIKAPACGLSTSTPLANIRAFTGLVKSGPVLAAPVAVSWPSAHGGGPKPTSEDAS
jgi:[methyl-Co(III) methanol-specific corrinoid protein]:coenzyme M methyltransferase